MKGARGRTLTTWFGAQSAPRSLMTAGFSFFQSHQYKAHYIDRRSPGTRQAWGNPVKTKFALPPWRRARSGRAGRLRMRGGVVAGPAHTGRVASAHARRLVCRPRPPRPGGFCARAAACLEAPLTPAGRLLRTRGGEWTCGRGRGVGCPAWRAAGAQRGLVFPGLAGSRRPSRRRGQPGTGRAVGGAGAERAAAGAPRAAPGSPSCPWSRGRSRSALVASGPTALPRGRPSSFGRQPGGQRFRESRRPEETSVGLDTVAEPGRASGRHQVPRG